VRRVWLSGLVLLAGSMLAADAAAAVSPADYDRQRFIARNSTTLRSIPGISRDSDRVRQPYPPRFYSDVGRGSQDCRWLMERAIETNNRNWLQRYRGCAQ
jgi:hypothetical protein